VAFRNRRPSAVNRFTRRPCCSPRRVPACSCSAPWSCA
jgi:hypothetical protein